VEALRQKLGESGEVCWINDRDAREGSLSPSARPGVRLMTIHAAKGLEFPAVIVSAVDQLPSPIHPDERRDCNLLYVALTRATNLLAVTWAGRSRFTERILEVTKGQQLPV
jgi:ATP-dependent exoDNAse (exonuclease V) beta subunit